MSKPRKQKLRQVLAANVRRERLARGWTQEDLVGESGLSQTYVSQVESAGRAVSIDVLEKLAAAFDVEAHLLLQP